MAFQPLLQKPRNPLRRVAVLEQFIQAGNLRRSISIHTAMNRTTGNHMFYQRLSVFSFVLGRVDWRAEIFTPPTAAARTAEFRRSGNTRPPAAYPPSRRR